MIDSIKIDPHGGGRLPDESARAYRAFCEYCDLGPNRSLDRAWESFCAQSNPGRVRQSARRPGHWAGWSQEFQWVKRAQTHDDQIDEARREANIQRRRKLEDLRLGFELEEQEQIQKLVRITNEKVEKEAAVANVEVTRSSQDKDTGIIIRSKAKAFSPNGMAVLLKARNATARQAILGVRGTQDKPKEEEKGIINRIIWDAPEDPETILAKELEERTAKRAYLANIKKEKKNAAQVGDQALSDQFAEENRMIDQELEKLKIE